MPIKRRRLRTQNLKKKCEIIHAKKRLSQRFNEKLTDSELKEIVTNVKNQRYKFHKRLTLRLTAWEANIKGHDTILIYDSKRHTVVSFLPPEFEVH